MYQIALKQRRSDIIPTKVAMGLKLGKEIEKLSKSSKLERGLNTKLQCLEKASMLSPFNVEFTVPEPHIVNENLI